PNMVIVQRIGISVAAFRSRLFCMNEITGYSNALLLFLLDVVDGLDGPSISMTPARFGQNFERNSDQSAYRHFGDGLRRGVAVLLAIEHGVAARSFGANATKGFRRNAELLDRGNRPGASNIPKN